MVITIKENKKEIIGAIFDMDGVLVDSISIHQESFNEVLGKLGLPPMTNDFFFKVIGRNTRDIINSYNDLHNLNLSENQLNDLLRNKGASFREKISVYGRTTPGVIDWLKFLQRKHVFCSVASSSTMGNITFVLEALKIADYFSSIVSGTYLPVGKPNPQIFLYAAASLGVDPSMCLVIEDAPVGIQAAKSAKMICWAIATTYTKPNLKNADIISDSLAQISPELLIETD